MLGDRPCLTTDYATISVRDQRSGFTFLVLQAVCALCVCFSSPFFNVSFSCEDFRFQLDILAAIINSLNTRMGLLI